MNTYWKRPAKSGKALLLGPMQINWENHGLRVHLTWPTYRTITLR